MLAFALGHMGWHIKVTIESQTGLIGSMTGVSHARAGPPDIFGARTKLCLVRGRRRFLSDRRVGSVVGISARDQRAAFASATVSAVMLTMRRTVADGVRMCTGFAAPSSTGPIAMPPPAAVLSRL